MSSLSHPINRGRKNRDAELEEMTAWAQEAADEARAGFGAMLGFPVVRVEGIPEGVVTTGLGRATFEGPVETMKAYLPADLATSPGRSLRRPKFGQNPLTGTPKPKKPAKKG